MKSGNAGNINGNENAMREKPLLSSRVWFLIVLALVLLSLLALWIYGNTRSPSAASTIAAIYQNGVCIRRVDLNSVTEEERFLLQGDAGENLILIQPGRICVAEADCPDQICVLQGWLPESNFPIACLPHGLIIQIEDK